MPPTQQAFQALVDAVGADLNGILARTEPVESVPQGNLPSTADLADFVHSRIETPNPELQADLGGRLTSIPFDYIVDGCYARAHIMAELLGDHGIDNAKLFVLGRLSARNTRFPRGVSWSYHVAPLVVVDDGAGAQLRVVDPSIATKPMPPIEWITTIDPGRSSVEIRCRDRAAYFPNGSQGSFDASLAAARGTLRKYAGRLGVATLAAEVGRPLSLTHDHDGVPIAVDVVGRTVSFNDSAMLYRIASDEQLEVLQAALADGQVVHLEADPETGLILTIT